MKKNMKKRWTYTITIAVALLVLGTTAYANRTSLALLGFNLFLSDSVEKSLENSYKPLEGREPVNVSKTNELQKPFSVLLLGVDQRGKETGRSDTMIYTVVRPKDGAILMVSIPRDAYVDIVGKDKEDKITHAYAFGGAKMAVETVEKLFDAPVTHYAAINFAGFRDVIDAMGGISLPIEKDLVNKDPDHEHFIVKAGQDSYNGVDALNYVRYREDAGGDMSRTERHQTFLNAMMEKASSIGQWTKIPELMEIMGGNFNTDMPPSQMIDLAKAMLQSNNRTIYSHTLKGEGHRLKPGGTWYFFNDEEDLSQTKTMIQSWLNEDTAKSSLTLPDKYVSKTTKPVQSLSANQGTESSR
ncbi:LCP family protein [Paenibacillus radicis (ex Gao et al. 2016)]|uniref:Transcriptional regulator LytR n=1 Tax=Paenibacillus radicis (ex Gao et al. 2016) TaxID=1737354 RepID=A0A917H938_9BACL|nr:LCP family protein [Paenibacillus radicis (ex Gao et al. 2016)]GGG71537.1 transcriptional regulator LytR [Paenibacillus radicis (ex Gao et al. 2016)]